MNANMMNEDPAGQPVDDAPFVDVVDRVTRRGRVVYAKLGRGDLVSYTTKAGKTAPYEVVQVIRGEILVGVYKGSKTIDVELQPVGGGKTFFVPRSKVYLAAKLDRSI